VWIYTGKRSAKFHGNTLSLSKNTAKILGGYFLTHTVGHRIFASNISNAVRDTIFGAMEVR